MSNATGHEAQFVGDDVRLDLAHFARTCGTTVAFVHELVLEGVMESRTPDTTPVFDGGDVVRVRRLLRLQRDFEATLPSAAVILDLLDEIDRLRAALRRSSMR